MIDIILCCYNQEKYIEQALLSIYRQNDCDAANLIIADDASTDRTLDIIKGIAPPEWISITCLPSQENLGLVRNYQRAFKACKSDLIFILEGDDFWDSPDHLSQHTAFLSSHQAISMSMNRLRLLFAATGKVDFSYWQEDWKEYKAWSLKEQILANRLGNLSGCCFRGSLIRELPARLFKISFADWLLGMIMAEHGDIAVLEESTSTYRIQPNGQWSRLSPEEQRIEMLSCSTLYNKYFRYKYRKIFKELSDSLKNKTTLPFGRRIKNYIKKVLKKG